MEFTKVENLVLNMSGGLLPEHLTKEEVKLLEKEYGDWWEVLGYSKYPEYIKPSFI